MPEGRFSEAETRAEKKQGINMFRKFFSATLGIGFALIVLTVVSYSLYAGGIYAVLKYENKQTVQVQSAVEGVPPDVDEVPVQHN